MANIALVILSVFGLFFLYTAALSLWRPVGFAASLGLEPIGRSGVVEIRAQYGGFFFAAALCQAAPILSVIESSIAFVVALVIFGGLIFGRLVALMDQRGGERLLPTVFALYWIDGAGALLALVGLIVSVGQ